LVEFPTHTKGNVLDLVLTNCQERVIDVCDAGRLGHSDHCMIKIELECSVDEECNHPPRYNWRRADMDSIQEELDSTDWRTELSRRPMEAAWTYFRERLEKAIETHMPSGTHRTN
jgi:hypothetical protein